MPAWTRLAIVFGLIASAPAMAQPVTFTRDVAPLIRRHCARCHRPDGASSVSLVTYANARLHARQMAQLTEARRMPPWQPDPEWGAFADAARLSDDEVVVFRRWIDDGLLEGEAGAETPVPAVADGWELGRPDLVLTIPSFLLRPDGPDMFRTFVVPVPDDADSRRRYVRAWEFRPDDPRVVHHATMQVDTTGASRRFDEADPNAGYEGLVAPSARAPDGFFLDWAPGHRAHFAIPGTSWPLNPGSDLVMMLHLRPSGRSEPVRASVGLYFTDTPPDRTPVMMRLTRQDFTIPAGAARFAVDDRYVLPVDVDVYTVQPHAHYVAREIVGEATRPDGTRVRLLRIADWDFNWQDVYRYERPVFLPAGTAISMRVRFDNSVDNPRNPNTPPVAVGYGQRTADEMAELWFQVIPRRPEDRPRLIDSLYRKVLPQEISGRRAMLARAPDDVALRDDLALMLAETGDVAAAEREFRAVLTQRPDSAAARFNVGMAVLMRGDRTEAERYFAMALAADGQHGPSHLQMGLLDQARGRFPDAAAHFNTALQVRPADPEVWLAAGVLDAMTGEEARSVVRLRRALALKPEWANAEAALASVLSSRPNASFSERAEGVALAERAVARTARGNSAFLDILAAAYESVGDRARARLVTREAIAAAERSGDSVAVERFRARLRRLERP